MTANKNNEQYSEEVTRILYKRPMWLVQWGILFVLVIFVILAVCARFIPYPVKLNVPLSIHDSTGIAMVPVQYGNFIQEGGTVKIFSYNENKRIKNSMTTAVLSVMPDSVSGQMLVTVIIPAGSLSHKAGNNDLVDHFLQITTRESNLLNEIFRPFTGLFSESGNKKNNNK
jgi:hypothetical protein